MVEDTVVQDAAVEDTVVAVEEDTVVEVALDETMEGGVLRKEAAEQEAEF